MWGPDKTYKRKDKGGGGGMGLGIFMKVEHIKKSEIEIRLLDGDEFKETEV